MFETLLNYYDSFKDHTLNQRRISDDKWNLLLNNWKNSPLLGVKEIGKSYQNRSINEVTFGKGKIKIAAWSQMHGDEATATLALADIYTFLSKPIQELEEIWQKIHQNICFHSIPQLNRDGAYLWQRETALGIDMNRDATKQNSPEAKLLSNWVDQINPLFSFNLHDQNRLYSAGNSKYQTQIALLATPGDNDGSWTESRIRAGKLANHLCKKLKPIIGNNLAKWTDEYESRAFGDTFQKRGYGLLLIEAGGMQWDLEKNYLRKLNACIILDSLYQIATGKWESESLNEYNSLLTNEKYIADIKIINAPLTLDGTQRADILFNIKEEKSGAENINFSWKIEDIGDMSHIHGLTEINGTDLTIIGNILPEKEKEYHQFILGKGNEEFFKLSNYTNKINKI